MNNMILKEIYRAVLFSKLASKYPSELDTGTKQSIFQEIHKIILDNNMSFIDNETCKCYMLKYNNTIYIAIHSLLLYSDSHKFIKLKDNIQVNKVLLQQYKALEDEIIKNINELNKMKLIKKIYVCGYNVGGALATLISAILAEKYHNMFLVSCFSFGSPKVGNKYFKKYFNEYITCNYRVKINNDSNTNIGYTGYCHVSNSLLLEKDNIIEMKENNHTCISSLILNMLQKKKDIESPIYIDEYIYRLNNLISIYQYNTLNKDISITQLLKSKKYTSTGTNITINDVVLPNKLYA